MSEWTVDEKVRFQRADAYPFAPPDIELLPGTVRCVVFGTMPDGRRFYNETFVTEEALADIGEERMTALLRADAHPPSEP